MNDLPLDRLISIIQEAGREIMAIYESDFAVGYKEDESPLTAADQASHRIIANGLQELDPDIPVLSEEGGEVGHEVRERWTRFWLVDPLDGTKEFVKRNGEFTVNIALIENGFPIFGMILVPCNDLLYYGGGQEAYKMAGRGVPVPIRVDKPSGSLVLVESRSHPSAELERFMADLSAKFSRMERLQKGSSLKFCAIAEGSAHLYPRFGPTMEWDTAAGQAIVEGAGGAVLGLDGKRFAYNKKSLRNGAFIAAVSDVIREISFRN